MEQARNTTCMKGTRNAYKISVGNTEGELKYIRRDNNKVNLK
jgi:hypothetical protein